jgi:hypothetical protein
MSMLNAAKYDWKKKKKMCWITFGSFQTIHVKRMIEDRFVTLERLAVPQNLYSSNEILYVSK